MYDWSEAQVRVNSGVSERIRCNVGVKHGDVLSPILFNLFLNDLPTELCDLSFDEDTPILNDTKIDCLLYADDLVIMSLTKEGLQCKLDHLFQYCNKWKMSVNVKKTKIMVLGGRKNVNVGESFRIGNEIVERVSSYKYLGVTLHEGGDMKMDMTNI